jgi:hypothetical protein
MKRFYFGDDEDEDEEYEEDEIDESRFLDAELIAMTQLGNADNNLLICSIKICEKSLFWIFLSTNKKIKIIEKVYNSLKKLTEGDRDAKI